MEEHGRNVSIAGLVTGRQLPGTASGVTFVTLEDEFGNLNVVVWRDLAERAEKSLRKGSLCYVSGKISTRKYTDKDGNERQVTDIVADQFRLLEKKEGQGADTRFPDSEPANQRAQTGRPNATEVDVPPSVEGDDLPF